MLICPVRACQLPLARQAHQVHCERGHSFDIAKSGYINLLQPQDRRSANPGDTPEAVKARRRLHDLGITAPLLEAIAATLKLTPDEPILDAGCGDGFYLSGLTNSNGHGLDISTPAIDSAARRYPTHEWIVANADRTIPYADQSFSAIISITARRNPPEFRRILQPNGRLLIAIPAPDDLIELRGPASPDRVQATVAEFKDTFEVTHQHRVTTTADLTAAAIRDIQHAIYRPLHPHPISAKRITFSLDLLLLEKSAVL